jgi:excisionase family DNA binding protein
MIFNDSPQKVVSGYSIEQVAQMLGVKSVTVRAWISRGEIQSHKYQGRRYITEAQIKDFRRFRNTGEFINMTYANGPAKSPNW